MNEGGEFVDIGLLLVCNLTAERKWLSSPSNNAAQKEFNRKTTQTVCN
jgi:hypothetical protein